jgi:hypothetical protein
MIANSCFHCWRHAQRLMNPAEVVVHVMERDRVFQILQLFGETVRQPRESAHRHSHGEILALNVAGRNVVVVGCAADNRFPCAHADCRTVPSLQRFLYCAVYFLQHRKINLAAKCIFNRCQISAMAVRRELNAIRKAFFQIVHEMIRAARVAPSDEPARHEFGIGVERNPSPAIASALALWLAGQFLSFA